MTENGNLWNIYICPVHFHFSKSKKIEGGRILAERKRYGGLLVYGGVIEACGGRQK